MIWWTVDNANGIWIALALGVLAFLAFFWNSGRVKYLVGAAILVVIGLLLYALTQLTLTDRRQVRDNMEALAFGALRQNPKPFQEFLSDDFEYGNLKKSEIAQHVIDTAKQFGVNGYKIWDWEIEELSREKGQAKALFKLRVDGQNGQFLALCRGTFVLERNVWRLKAIQMYNIMGGFDQPIHVPLR